MTPETQRPTKNGKVSRRARAAVVAEVTPPGARGSQAGGEGPEVPAAAAADAAAKARHRPKKAKRAAEEGVLRGKVGALPTLPEAARQAAGPAVQQELEQPTEDAPGQGPRFFWEEPGGREFLADRMRKRIAARKRQESSATKDGVTLARADTNAAVGGSDAADFMNAELFGRRKRKRDIKDRYDRTLGGFRKQDPINE